MAEIQGHAPPSRPPHVVMLSVWKALFLREMINRIAAERIAWVWMIVEPLAHIAFLAALLTLGFRTRNIAGGSAIIFVMVGILGFFMTRNVMTRTMDAVERGANLYAFRQVKPVDVLIVRGLQAGFTEGASFLLIMGAAGLLGHPIIPKDPLLALGAVLGLWSLGLGLGLVFSVPSTLFSEFGRALRIAMIPLYFMSAVIFPSAKMPPAVRQYLLWNPILHGLESLRLAFMPTYVVPPGISLGYVYVCALPFIFIGLALQVQYRMHMMTK